MYLLQGACEVSVKSDVKSSNILVDGILIGHGEASTKVPCGQKKIQVLAGGKWTIEEYKNVEARLPLELSYQMHDLREVKDWAMSSELVEQLQKGQGPIDVKNQKYKEIIELRAKQRAEQGFSFTVAELTAAAKKAAGGADDATSEGGPIKIDPNTNFDDPKTWM